MMTAEQAAAMARTAAEIAAEEAGCDEAETEWAGQEAWDEAYGRQEAAIERALDETEWAMRISGGWGD